MKNTAATFKKAKQDGKKISMLTAYDYSTAKLEDEAGINGILVGDSLGNVILGYEDTISVTMEDMIHPIMKGIKNQIHLGKIKIQKSSINNAVAKFKNTLR